jgi:GTP-binding protein
MSAVLPLVALVGRPNVGKSTLFNRLVGWRKALTDDQPGVTRDRIFGTVRYGDSAFRLVDTGGFAADVKDTMLAAIREQTQLAIDEADLVILVLDRQEGLRPDDHEIVELLRRAGKPTLAVVNKVDVPAHEADLSDFFRLGIAPILAVSAEHALGMGDLTDAVLERIQATPAYGEAAASAMETAVCPETTASDARPDLETASPSRIDWAGGPIHVAVVGRPNVGKSSLINRLLGEDRLLTTEVPGTTRDAIDTEFHHEGHDFVLIDTAGIRRKSSIAERVERFAVVAALRSIERADVVVVVLDAAQTISQQDAHIAALAHERGKGMVLAVNKWDLMPAAASRQYLKHLNYEIGWLAYPRILKLSAKTGKGVAPLWRAIVAAQRERHRRVSTGELNRFFRDVVAEHQPPSRKGRRPRLYFFSQPLVRPPTFVVASRHGDYVDAGYVRYLQNALRKRYGFQGTPIWIKFRPHRAERIFVSRQRTRPARNG